MNKNELSSPANVSELTERKSEGQEQTTTLTRFQQRKL